LTLSFVFPLTVTMKTSVSGVLVVIESSRKRWTPTKLAFSAAGAGAGRVAR